MIKAVRAAILASASVTISPGGLLVVQDGMNAPDNQNFKLIAWGDVVAALGLQQ